MLEVTYTANDALATIRPDWLGTPITAKGRYVNHEYPYLTSLSAVLKWKLGPTPQATEKKHDGRRLQVADPAAFFASSDDGIVWLGHASFFIRIGGITILTDPVFYKLPFVREWITIPNPIADLPRIDYLLVSHDHRDHCDQRSITELGQKYSHMQVHVGLGLKGLLHSWLPQSCHIVEHGWYQRWQQTDELQLDYLPTRHWGRRGLTDTNKRLWGAFMISVGDRRIYFGGDSGYGSHFAELATMYEHIDLAILGIGAYSPRWFMHHVHMAPELTSKAFADMKASKLLPMHYGKYDLSDEPPGEPRELIQKEMEQAGRIGDLVLLNIGEEIDFAAGLVRYTE